MSGEASALTHASMVFVLLQETSITATRIHTYYTQYTGTLSASCLFRRVSQKPPEMFSQIAAVKLLTTKCPSRMQQTLQQ